MRRAVAYIRVSSEEQGKSGFGLASQEVEIKAFARAAGYTIVRWKRDVASAIGGGSVSGRPGLKDALAEARLRRLPILISRLDRLSRDTNELEDLAQASGVEFVSVREPGTSDGLVLKVQGERIARETQMLSDRTKAGLQRAKAEGRVLGNTKNLADAQKIGAATNRRKAELRMMELSPVILDLKAAGLKSAAAIAEGLNSRSIQTSSGKPWTGPNVQRILKQIKKNNELDQAEAATNHMKNDPLWGSW